MREPTPKQKVLPGLIDPGREVFTDRKLSQILGVTAQAVGQWRQKKIIPYKMDDSAFAKFNVADVVKALQKEGYKVDPKKIGQ